MTRKCDTCTKCCEGYLSGEAKGKSFYIGKPCHFVSIGKGCSIYSERPKNPCVSYKCSWITNQDIPEWMKPDFINTIIDTREIKGISFINVVEAGQTLRADVLTWVIRYAISQGMNIRWQVNGSFNWLGSDEFNTLMTEIH